MPRVRMSPRTRSQTMTGTGPPRRRKPRPAASAARPRAKSPTRSRTSGRLGLQHHGGAIGDDLAHGLADLGGIEAHHDDGVSAHGGCVLHHAVHGMAPRLLQQSRVFMDLAADDGAKPRHEIAADAAAAHHNTEALPLHLPNSLSRDPLACRDKHLALPWQYAGGEGYAPSVTRVMGRLTLSPFRSRLESWMAVPKTLIGSGP